MKKLILIGILAGLTMACTTLKANYKTADSEVNIDYTYNVFQSKSIKAYRLADGSIVIDTNSNSETMNEALKLGRDAINLVSGAAK